MKVLKLRELLSKIARMQDGQGDAETANALEQLSEILKSRDKDDVCKTVDSIEQRRSTHQTQ